jgi:hypothetical protein
MSDIYREWFKTWQQRMSMFSERYNRDTEEAVKYVTGHSQGHCAWLYVHIHGAVMQMGGMGKFRVLDNKTRSVLL